MIDGRRVTIPTKTESWKKLKESLLTRRCTVHDTVLHGSNFGEDTSQLNVYVDWKTETKLGKASSMPPYSVFEGVGTFVNWTYVTDIMDRRFSGESDQFTFEHTHNKLVLRGPVGFGHSCRLYVRC